MSAPDDASPRWLTEDQQRTWRAYLLGSARLRERMDTDLRQFSVDLPEYEILVFLEESTDRQLRMSDLAAAVHSSRSRLTHTISRMERSGLVERLSCPSDRRGVWAHLTEAGMDLLRTAAPSHVLSVRRYFVEAIDPKDYEALGRAFAAVVEATGS
jgi:DNA-binding MarR family transcriptional regulator